MPEDTWVRDRMAIERTSLANERTMLAYVRTAIALFAAGGTAIHFLESAIVDVIGWVMIAGGVFVLAYGAYRFRQVSALISSVHHKGPPPSGD
jgi:putative membrane protein